VGVGGVRVKTVGANVERALNGQSAFDRWWSGPRGAYLIGYTERSVLLARNVVSDEAIEAALIASDQKKD
jgi:hypothetical protein